MSTPGSTEGPSLSPLQTELLVALYDQQRRYRTDREHWGFDGTIWSRASFVLARAHDKLRKSPAPGRHNVERSFEQRLHRAGDALIRKGLCERRKVRGPEAPAKFAQGYKRHKVRDRDTFLSNAGLEAAEAALRGAGLMAAELARCTDQPAPSTPLPNLSGCDD